MFACGLDGYTCLLRMSHAGRALPSAAMLLSRMFRAAAITGRADAVDSARVNAFFGGRQGGRWAQQTVAAAFPNAAPHVAQGSPPAAREPSPADPAETLRELTKLHQRGVVNDAEFEGLRAQLRA
jgi:predicted nucleic acid-binding Zn ribbon protein